MTASKARNVGLLLGGGLDSTILLGKLLSEGSVVQPFYVRAGLRWETAELAAVERLLAALESPQLAPLVVLEQSADELYGDHWSLTGESVPDATTPDAAVYLPGRNLLLLVQAALWCQLHGIPQLAIGVLGSNPFPDATPEFFASLEQTCELAAGQPVSVIRPFEHLHKSEVMQLGKRFPLELSFSCIDPRGPLHCGVCNKCAERKQAFASIGLVDPTPYSTGDCAQQFGT
jgi:7-cyano-7-deazaguanine synthase